MLSLSEPAFFSRLKKADRMSVYFTVDLDGLAAANQYLARIEDTVLMRQVSARIEVFREELPKRRPPRQYPH